jgi:hypothetical protein
MRRGADEACGLTVPTSSSKTSSWTSTAILYRDRAASAVSTRAVSVTNSPRVRVSNGILKKLNVGVQVLMSGHSDFNTLMLMENCTGIELRESSENNVSYTDISPNKRFGVNVNGNNSLNGRPNNHITLPNAEVMEAGLGGLILDNGADSNVIAFNAFSRNLQNGVVFSRARKNIVTSNIVTQTSEAGSGGTGIRIQIGTGNFLVRNIALDNQVRDLEDQNMDCDHNIWKDNTFLTRSPASCLH